MGSRIGGRGGIGLVGSGWRGGERGRSLEGEREVGRVGQR